MASWCALLKTRFGALARNVGVTTVSGAAKAAGARVRALGAAPRSPMMNVGTPSWSQSIMVMFFPADAADDWSEVSSPVDEQPNTKSCAKPIAPKTLIEVRSFIGDSSRVTLPSPQDVLADSGT